MKKSGSLKTVKFPSTSGSKLTKVGGGKIATTFKDAISKR